jgi:predicted transposase/invertase (TIGR01784 family)
MRFINPKIDFAFKKIFGSDRSQPILISFLNALVYDEQPRIQSLEILDPYLAPPIRGMKDTYLDVNAMLDDGTSVIIEMQVLNMEGFEKRVLYNATKAYAQQLAEGVSYTALNPVIALTITDFVMFKDIAAWQTRFVLKEAELLLDYISDELMLMFIELPKFQKSLAELNGVREQWVYFLRHAEELQTIPESLATTPPLRQAFEIANRANLGLEEFNALQKREIFWQDQRGMLQYAERMAREKGHAEGRAEGHAEGLSEGQRAERLALGRAMLREGLERALILKLTGLTDDELATLRE